MKKRILPIIIILEIAMIFVFCILKRNYTYDGYTFHLDNVNIYSVSSGESSVGEKILVMPDGSVEFRENLYAVRMSGYKNDGFKADIHRKDDTNVSVDHGEDWMVVHNFIWAVYARNSPMIMFWVFLLDLAGWIFVKNPDIPFFLLYSWRVKEELHPSEAFYKITQCLGYAAYVYGIYLTCQYLFG